MDLASLNNFNANVWYRGFKKLNIVTLTSDKIIFSNGDKIEIDGNDIYLNKTLICNDVISENDLMDMYKYYLLKKGYKFLE
jgi:hypothetical protein